MEKKLIYNDDKSNKFWNIKIIKSEFIVAYGKIGTKGISQTKKFESEEKCKKEAQKIINEKLKKGYKENVKEKSSSNNPALIVLPDAKKDMNNSISLIFVKKATGVKWMINLWSNIISYRLIKKDAGIKFNKDNYYRFEIGGKWEIQQKSFYKSGKDHILERKEAIAEFEKQVNQKISEGFELFMDSRSFMKKSKEKTKVKLSKKTSTDKLNSKTPWQQLRYFGTRYYEIDKDSYIKSLKALKTIPAYKNIPAEYSDFELPDNIPDSYNDLFNETSEQSINFTNLLAAKHSIADKTAKLIFNGDINNFNFSDTLFIHGDVHVKGNLEFSCSLFITGNLIVDGIIRDLMEFSPLLAGGNINAKAIDCGSQIYCAGEIQSEFISIDGTGELVCSKLSSNLLIENGFDHSINAKLNVNHHIKFSDKQEEEVKKIIEIINPDIAKKIETQFKKDGEDNFYFDKDFIFKPLQKGEKILKN